MLQAKDLLPNCDAGRAAKAKWPTLSRSPIVVSHLSPTLRAQESVSEHSPGPIEDGEIPVRTMFRDRGVGHDGRPKPSYFRKNPNTRGFSVDRMRVTDPESLLVNKKADARYNGYLRFIVTRSTSVRTLQNSEGLRLFCIYDSATAQNRAHADICQNVHLEPGTKNRKKLMMEFAWQLRESFSGAHSVPPAQPTVS